MDGSFDPSESNDDSIERNVEASSEETTTPVAIATERLNSTLTQFDENSSQDEESRRLSASNEQTPLFQIYQDLDDQQRPIVQITSNEEIIAGNNNHFLLQSTSREDQHQQVSPTIRYIDARSIYNLKDLNKRGTNGKIWTANWTESENRSELVAVKEEMGSKAEKDGKVIYEAEKLNDLNHENIIGFYGMIHKSHSADWTVMELGDCSLNEFLNDLRQLLPNAQYGIRDIFSYRNCVEFFLQIARGMEYAHLKVNALWVFNF
jgi:hypothetical protein